MYVISYDQIMEAAAQTARDEAARDARREARNDEDVQSEARRQAPAVTAAQIEALEVGDLISSTLDIHPGGRVREGARWTQYREVVRIAYRGTSVKGEAYIGVETTFGPASTLGFSIGEGEERFRIAARRGAQKG